MHLHGARRKNLYFAVAIESVKTKNAPIDSRAIRPQARPNSLKSKTKAVVTIPDAIEIATAGTPLIKVERCLQSSANLLY